MGVNMDCKDEEKMIPVFLQDELDIKVLNQFIEHIDGCPECMEELSIQFLVAEGLERLEAGNNFNLQSAGDKAFRRETSDQGAASTAVYTDLSGSGGSCGNSDCVDYYIQILKRKERYESETCFNRWTQHFEQGFLRRT